MLPLDRPGALLRTHAFPMRVSSSEILMADLLQIRRTAANRRYRNRHWDHLYPGEYQAGTRPAPRGRQRLSAVTSTGGELGRAAAHRYVGSVPGPQ